MNDERSCWGCDACCREGTGSVTAAQKEAYQRCPRLLAAPNQDGGWCAAYEERPVGCRAYQCAWRLGLVPERLSPLHVGVVATLSHRPGGGYVLEVAEIEPGALRSPDVKLMIAELTRPDVSVRTRSLPAREP